MLRSRWAIYRKSDGVVIGVVIGYSPKESMTKGVIEHSSADINTHKVDLITFDVIEGDFTHVPTSSEILSSLLSLRKQAYQEEADPLYMEWKYDQTPVSEQTWRDKVAEIKVRIPLIV